MPDQKLLPIGKMPLVTLPADFDTNVGPFLAACYDQHGPVFRAGIWGEQVVFMVGPAANKCVLVTQRQQFSHEQGWTPIIGDMLGRGLLNMDGAEHDGQRKIMNPAFTSDYMGRYLPLMAAVIERRIAGWGAAGVVDVYDEARKITFDIAAEALVGFAPGPQVDRFRQLFTMLLNDSPEPGSPPMPTDPRPELYRLLLERIRERRRNPSDDVLGLMLQARDEQGRALSDEQVLGHTNILLVAGHETSTSLAAWLLYLLAAHGSFTERVLHEQDALWPAEMPLTLEQIKGMDTLRLALSEAERLYPPVANGPRGTLGEVAFGGYSIPAGTSVYYSIAGCHRIASIFANPDRFDPDRFAPPREEHKRHPYSLVGFGGGPRICIGINFAQVEIMALVSQVLRRYSLAVVPGQRLVQFYRTTALPLYGINLMVRERTE